LRTSTGLVLDLSGELAGDGEHHVFLPRAPAPDGARVLAAVTGIDGDDQIPQLARRIRRRARDAFFQRLAGVALVVKIHHQAVTVLLVGFQQEAARAYGFVQIEHHAQIAIVARRVTDAIQQLVGIRRPIHVTFQRRVA
jgi:hypothetical protein